MSIIEIIIEKLNKIFHIHPLLLLLAVFVFSMCGYIVVKCYFCIIRERSERLKEVEKMILEDEEMAFILKSVIEHYPPPPDLVKASVWLEYRKKLLDALKKAMKK